MVYRGDFGSDTGEDKTAVFDLRQIYAQKIIGETLVNIKIARINENYSTWYHLLKRDLFTEISQKLTAEEIKEIKNKIEQTKKVITSFCSAYKKISKKADEHEQIENALCELEMKMTKLMEKHKMYGAKEDRENL